MNKTTGIGSLPFTDLNLALEFSLSLDLPYVPELINLNEKMDQRDSNFLVQACERSRHQKLKNQILGPATFFQLTGKNEKDYFQYFKMNLKNHSDLKSIYDLKLFLQIDEPVLLPFEKARIIYLQLLQELKKENIQPIMHSCQKIPENFIFPNWENPYLAIDVQLNPKYIEHPLLLIEGYDPRINKRRSQSEYVSFTCGYGLLNEKELKEIQEKLKG